MSEDKAQEKSFEPTERRRQQFRERGEVPRSKEVTGVLGLAIAVVTLTAFLQRMGAGLQDMFRYAYTSIPSGDISLPIVMGMCEEVVFNLIGILAGPLVILWLGAALVCAIQGRGAIAKEPIKFELDKLNPLPGFQKIFLSTTPFVELAKGLLKLGLIGWMVWTALEKEMGILPEMTYMSLHGILQIHYEMAMLVVMRALPIGLIIAVLDYAHQWYQLHEKMMMTREDMKEENRDMEGDPHVRAARKQRQREIASVKAVRDVRRATVIVTNPTHYAVAIRYNPEEAPAPMVLCKGIDHLAMKIKAEARKHEVPTIENRPLARALYATAVAGQMIPEELYSAVAQIIAIIVRRRKKPQVTSPRP